ncbi:hypothetical protein LSCM1_02939 [Leishmania martiniquensis]|uniref:Uncharacterized protein n=1 Tax=Leishmania martiniquensis TaxID=1580590 RepID=A0A836KLU0_9TRYP|nr:hypothetical protein LSCM1_02939 [Leishmania martiniquensis]
MDAYYYMLAFMFAFVFIVLFLLTRSAGKIAKEREAAALGASSAEAEGSTMGSTRIRRARREE